MYKLARRILKTKTCGGSTTQIYDKMLQTTRKSLLNLIFTLAMASKVTPTKLANIFDKEKIDEYAERFHAQLVRGEEKQREKTKKKLENICKK